MTTTLRTIAATLAALVVAGLAGTAHADLLHPTPRPEVAYPLDSTTVVVEGVGSGGPVARTVADYAARIPQLDVRTDTTCDAMPDAACIIVVRQNVGPPFRGLATFERDGARLLVVNTYFHGNRRPVACHNLGELLGLDHHVGAAGCLGADHDTVRVASRGEINALRAAYR